MLNLDPNFDPIPPLPAPPAPCPESYSAAGKASKTIRANIRAFIRARIRA